MCISFYTCNCERCDEVGKGHLLCVLAFLLVIVNDVMEWVKGICLMVNMAVIKVTVNDIMEVISLSYIYIYNYPFLLC